MGTNPLPDSSLLARRGNILPLTTLGQRPAQPELMDADDLHPLDDYSHRFFIWHEWIQVIPMILLIHLQALTEPN